jgi:sn-glycerol 3-phosphate transport system permease protein
MLWNTIVMASTQTSLQLVFALPAAFAFAKFNFRGKHWLLSLVSLTWLVPFTVLMIPNYVTISALGWRNTITGMVVPSLGSAFAVLTLLQAVKSFPNALLDAARIDGLGGIRTLVFIIIPNITANIAALSVLLFISAWNDYFWPLLVSSRMDRTTIQIGLQMFLSSDGTAWGPLMAAASLSSIPVLLLYLLMQRQIVESFVSKGIK